MARQRLARGASCASAAAGTRSRAMPAAKMASRSAILMGALLALRPTPRAARNRNPDAPSSPSDGPRLRRGGLAHEPTFECALLFGRQMQAVLGATLKNVLRGLCPFLVDQIP